ncbi:MAG: hypothetical protein EA397_15115 [Deltaproteobacteria bacterium]|nr:MAG: hypothetical protein EA397_15115 [Deltaproteobacteria bacterium]
MSTTVWFDADRARFWQIPDGVAIPAGPLPIFALTGHRQRVQASALERYALTEDQVRRAVVEELLRAARHTGRAMGTVSADLAGQALARLPRELSLAQLEEQLGPMTSWADPARASQVLRAGRDSLREGARRAGERVDKTRRLARKTARTASSLGKIVAANPELTQAAFTTARDWVRRRPAKKAKKDTDDR